MPITKYSYQIPHLPLLPEVGDTLPTDTVYFEDIIAVANDPYLYGDTSFVAHDGLDTIIMLDTIAANIDTSNMIEAKTVGKSTDIIIDLGNIPVSVNRGLLGINVSSMFDHLPEGNTTAPQWDMLSALSPKALRYPDGSGSKFMHPLGSLNPDGTMNGGYGYYLDEIIRYLDYTDGTLNFTYNADGSLNASDKTAIQNDMLDTHCDDCHTWMDGDYVPSFLDYYNQCSNQIVFNPALYASREDEPLFINQFIRLVKQIELENNDTVDVLVCLNILSEKAETCKELVTYLRNNTIHAITVAGVEIGNESGSQYYTKTIGYNYFSQYWDYIYRDGFDFNLSQACPGMVGHHNYLKVLKSDPAFHVKIGIPADNLYGTNAAGQPYALRHDNSDPCWLSSGILISPGDPKPLCGVDWNVGLAAKLNAGVLVGGGPLSIPAFDALILHPYYTSEANWSNFPQCITGPFPYTTAWNYATEDTRIGCAYDGITGLGSLFGNFKDYFTTRYKEAYDKHNEVLKFKTNHKELWETEWNIKNNSQGSPLFPATLYDIFANTFVHNVYIQESILKNIKMNYDATYGSRPFFTYATIQNFAGGTSIDMLNKGDAADLAYWTAPGKLLSGIPGVSSFVPRASYFADTIIADIGRKRLNYLPSTITLAKGVNLPPTVFVDQAKENVYVYYSNMKNKAQSYIVNAASAISWKPGAVALGFGPVSVLCVQAYQLYTSAGKTALFFDDVNSYYTGSNHPVDIVRTNPMAYTNTEACEEDIHAGSICVTMPAYSEGYFKIPLYFFYVPIGHTASVAPQNTITLYPNPANSSFTVLQTHATDVLYITVYDMAGRLYIPKTRAANNMIDIDMLPAGVYSVLLQSDSFQTTKLLVKQ